MDFRFLDSIPTGIIVVEDESQNVIYVNKSLQLYLNQFEKPGNHQDWLGLLRQRANLLLETKELQLITESVPGGIIILDLDQGMLITYANKAFYELVGYTKEEMETVYKSRADSLIHNADLPAAIDSFRKQLPEKDNKFHLELRLETKSGDLRWVNVDGLYMVEESEHRKLYCILTECTSQISTLLQLKKEQTYNKIILELSDDILFDMDIKEGSVTFSNNAAKKLNLPLRLDRFPFSALQRRLIYRDDVPKFLELCRKVKGGFSGPETELRVLQPDGKIVWCVIDYKLIYGEDHTPTRAIGKIMDISDQKAKMELLRKEATTDHLTDVMNKAETQKQIEKHIKSKSSEGDVGNGIFYILDIDNFKGINDTFGHHFGDMVLAEVANRMKRLIRSNDIIGRVGGDEFVVFLKGNIPQEIGAMKANELLSCFEGIFRKELKNTPLSGSIGVAFCPQHGASFDELYEHSDIALYESKRKGKACYTLYNKDMAQGLASNPTMIEVTRCVSDYFKGDIAYTVFEMLYETQDMKATINMLLGFIGQKFDVDRCYIFESSADGQLYNNTYEWCKEGISPEIDKLQALPAENLEYLFSQYKKDGVFYCKNIEEMDEYSIQILSPQGIKSMLHCGIYHQGKICGFVGFDACIDYRNWSGEEVAVLTYVSKILSVFLIRNK